MIKVFFKRESKVFFHHKKLFKKAAQITMDHLNINYPSEVNVIITDNEKIKALSHAYKKKNEPTDVLSFPGEWKKLSELIGYNMLGDIYISHEKIKEQSKKYNHSKKREWTYLFIHGLLHCLEYNHLNKNQEDEMNGIAKIILNKIKVGRNG